MTDENKRSLVQVNKFQKLIIVPIIIFCAIAGIMVYLTLEYNIRISINPKEATILSIDALQFKEAVPYMIISIAAMLICIVGWTYYITNRIVGPHNRIIKELDDLIDGSKEGPITVRKDDKMFSELVSRINKIAGL